ncbi:MAG: hypothetical protein VKL59_14490 [Nostocaceae cyanobacterium]|nr:hypothetical protein [Nostocaceae cyanobacterium]
MEKNQRRSQPISKASEPKPTKTRSRMQPQSKQQWNALLSVVAAHPWLVWSGMVTFIIASTAVSLLSLTYAGRVEHSETEAELEPATVPVAPATTAVSTEDRSISVWLLVSMAIACATGSLVMFRLLNAPSRSRVRRSRRTGKGPNPGGDSATPPRNQKARPVRKPKPRQAAGSPLHPPTANPHWESIPDPAVRYHPSAVKLEPVVKQPPIPRRPQSMPKSGKPMTARPQPQPKPISLLSRTQPVSKAVIPLPRRPQPLAKPGIYSSTRPQPVPQPVSIPLKPRPVAQPAPIPRRPQPLVTILSPEERLPLDRSEQSLADMMDVRKHRPLGSILRHP